MQMKRNLIIDVGMNDGADTAFYLAKGFDVVARAARSCTEGYVTGGAWTPRSGMTSTPASNRCTRPNAVERLAVSAWVAKSAETNV